MRTNGHGDPRRARWLAFRADHPGWQISRHPARGGWSYTAVARHHGMQPPVARARTLGQLGGMLEPDGMMPLDASVPNAARIYDYWLGGKDNFAADREVARQVLTAQPDVARLARANRAFTTRAVEWACRGGVGQVLDLGAGMPTEARHLDGRPSHEWEPTHVAAQSGWPGARCLYIDYDPVVVRHIWAMYPNPGDGPVLVDAAGGDLRDPDVIWSLGAVRTMLDLDRPLVLVLTAVLHFMPPDVAREIVAAYVDQLAAGSYVVLSSCCDAAGGDAVTEAYNTSDAPTLHNFTRGQIGDLLDGLVPVVPGLVAVDRWLPGWDEPRLATGGQAGVLAAVGWKKPPP
jgi:hypothetical protein